MSVLMGVPQPHQSSSQKLAACGASAMCRKAHRAFAGWTGDWMAGLSGPLPHRAALEPAHHGAVWQGASGSSQKAAVFSRGPFPSCCPSLWLRVVSLNCLLPAPSTGALVRLPSHTSGLAPAGVYDGGVTACRLGSDPDCGQELDSPVSKPLSIPSRRR